jgi:hypothetical protein
MAQNETVETGIRRKKGTKGYEVYVSLKGKYFSRCFPSTASLASMRRWRMEQYATQETADIKTPKLPHQFPASPQGFCYLYIIRAGFHLKIGRAVNVWTRLRELQTGSPDKYELLAAVPSHAAIEPLIHLKFKHHHIQGEWFEMGEDILSFAKWLRSGDRNPLVFLWPGAAIVPPAVETVSGESSNQAVNTA